MHSLWIIPAAVPLTKTHLSQSVAECDACASHPAAVDLAQGNDSQGCKGCGTQEARYVGGGCTRNTLSALKHFYVPAVPQQDSIRSAAVGMLCFC